MAVLVSPSASSAVVSSSPVVSPALLAVFADEDGTAVELGVLELADGAGGFGRFLVDDDAAAFGAAVVSLEHVGLMGI